MDYSKMRIKWTIFLLIATMSAFGVSITILLTEDKMILALISVVAVILTVMATVLVTCFFIEIKETEQLQIQQRHCEMAMRRNYECGLFATSRLHMSGAQSSSIIPPMVMLPTVAGNIVDEFPMMMRAPPSYEESADLENTRVQSYSNAPPAYADSTVTNIASFSPPPFYRPLQPETSVQTASIYLSSEGSSSSSSSASSIEIGDVHEERSVHDRTVTRVLSPLPTRKFYRRHAKINENRRKNDVVTITVSAASTPDEVRVPTVIPDIDTQSSSNSSSSEVMTNVTSPSSSTSSIERPALPQMFIDCSKAEPTLITINRDESII